MGASVFANLRRRSALKARASIIISRPRPRWPPRSCGDTETGFWRRSRRSRMSAPKMPSPRTGRRFGRRSIGTDRCAFAVSWGRSGRVVARCRGGNSFLFPPLHRRPVAQDWRSRCGSAGVPRHGHAGRRFNARPCLRAHRGIRSGGRRTLPSLARRGSPRNVRSPGQRAVAPSKRLRRKQNDRRVRSRTRSSRRAAQSARRAASRRSSMRRFATAGRCPT